MKEEKFNEIKDNVIPLENFNDENDEIFLDPETLKELESIDINKILKENENQEQSAKEESIEENEKENIEIENQEQYVEEDENEKIETQEQSIEEGENENEKNEEDIEENKEEKDQEIKKENAEEINKSPGLFGELKENDNTSKNNNEIFNIDEEEIKNLDYYQRIISILNLKKEILKKENDFEEKFSEIEEKIKNKHLDEESLKKINEETLKLEKGISDSVKASEDFKKTAFDVLDYYKFDETPILKNTMKDKVFKIRVKQLLNSNSLDEFKNIEEKPLNIDNDIVLELLKEKAKEAMELIDKNIQVLEGMKTILNSVNESQNVDFEIKNLELKPHQEKNSQKKSPAL